MNHSATINSSSSSRNDPTTGSSSTITTSNSNTIQLKITEQPPSYAFLEEWIEIALSYDANNNEFITEEDKEELLNNHLTLHATLKPFSNDTELLCNNNDNNDNNTAAVTSSFWDHNNLQLVTDPPRLPEVIHTKSSGNILVRCKVVPTVEHDKTPSSSAPIILPTDREIKVCIHFTLKDQTNTITDNTLRGLVPSHISTRPIQLVNYKFALLQEEEEMRKTSAMDEEDVWYKDEGGRDKSMMAHVTIVAGRNKSSLSLLPLKNDIPFHTTLLYATNTGAAVQEQQQERVRNQDILRVFGPAKQYIDAVKGRALVLYRIEEVSKSHQGHLFQLEIRSPADGRMDIAPVRTRPVSVRSKRNKRQRLSILSATSSTSTPQEVAAAESLTNISPMITHKATGGATAAVAAAITPNIDTRKLPPTSSTTTVTPSLPQQRSASSSTAASSNNHHHPQIPVSTNYNGTYINNNPTPTVRVETLIEMKEALNRVHNWVDIVVNNLKSLQWKIIGYDHNLDGSVNFNQPYYNMPNPNSCISNLLAMYSNSTREDIFLLRSSLDSTMSTATGQNNNTISTSISNDYSAVEEPPPRNTTYNESALEAIGKRTAYLDSSIINSVSKDQPIANSDATDEGEEKEEAEGTERHPKDVMYVLARNYKVSRTGKPLGFPVFNSNRELVGFFKVDDKKQGNNTSFSEMFLPISCFAQDFGPVEREQATQILNVAIESRIEALHCLTDYNNSVSKLIQDCIRFAMVTSGSSCQSSSV